MYTVIYRILLIKGSSKYIYYFWFVYAVKNLRLHLMYNLERKNFPTKSQINKTVQNLKILH